MDGETPTNGNTQMVILRWWYLDGEIQMVKHG